MKTSSKIETSTENSFQWNRDFPGCEYLQGHLQKNRLVSEPGRQVPGLEEDAGMAEKGLTWAFFPIVSTVLILVMLLPTGAAALQYGDKAPLFETDMLEGGTFSLKDHRNKNVVLLNFWSVFCRDCISRIEALNKISDLYQKRNFILVGIAGDPPTPRMLARVKKYAAKMHYPVIMDSDLHIYQSYGVEIIPFAVLVDLDGNVVMAIQSLEPEPLKEISDRIDALTSE